jgi:hypothetical protein
VTDYVEDNVANRIEGDNSRLKNKADRGASKTVSIKEGEELFTQALREPLSQAEEIAEADIVVGIPFYNEADTIGSVIKTATKGLKEFYPDEKCVIVAAGSPAGGAALKVVNNLPHVNGISRIAFLLNDERINGKGWSLRAIAEIARRLGANLAILEADLRSRSINGEIEGLAPDCSLNPLSGRRWTWLSLDLIAITLSSLFPATFFTRFLPLFTSVVLTIW